jgi:hypothetical protein
MVFYRMVFSKTTAAAAFVVGFSVITAATALIAILPGLAFTFAAILITRPVGVVRAFLKTRRRRSDCGLAMVYVHLRYGLARVCVRLDCGLARVYVHLDCGLARVCVHLRYALARVCVHLRYGLARACVRIFHPGFLIRHRGGRFSVALSARNPSPAWKYADGVFFLPL